MAARFEITKKYARAYASAPKKGKSLILDHVVEVTGWNRDHARQQLVARLAQTPGRAVATVAAIERYIAGHLPDAGGFRPLIDRPL